jgi:hypothetical protein
MGESTCQQCAVGRYTTTEGQSICSTCEVGRYNNVNGSSSCSTCSMNGIDVCPGDGHKYTCQSTSKVLPNADSINCCVCPPGQYILRTVFGASCAGNDTCYLHCYTFSDFPFQYQSNRMPNGFLLYGWYHEGNIMCWR